MVGLSGGGSIEQWKGVTLCGEAERISVWFDSGFMAGGVRWGRDLEGGDGGSEMELEV